MPGRFAPLVTPAYLSTIGLTPSSPDYPMRHVLFATLVALAVTGVAPASHAAMHLRLAKSEPARDAVVAAPKQLSLWFSLKPAMSITTVKLTGASAIAIRLGKPTHSGDVNAPVVVAIEEALPPGKYTVAWKTASSDMHPVSGSYTFSVK